MILLRMIVVHVIATLLVVVPVVLIVAAGLIGEDVRCVRIDDPQSRVAHFCPAVTR